MIVDPGLYGSKNTDVFWVKERRAIPSSFKLFLGKLKLYGFSVRMFDSNFDLITRRTHAF